MKRKVKITLELTLDLPEVETLLTFFEAIKIITDDPWNQLVQDVEPIRQQLENATEQGCQIKMKGRDSRALRCLFQEVDNRPKLLPNRSDYENVRDEMIKHLEESYGLAPFND